MAKQLNEIYFYVSRVRPSQNTEHAILRQITSKWKTRFDYRKLLNKKISLNTFFLIEYKYIFLYEKKIRLKINFFKTQVYFDLL